MNKYSMSLTLDWRIEQLYNEINDRKKEILRLMDVVKVGDGGHDWDPKMLRCWLCEMSWSTFEWKFQACRGRPILQPVLEFSI
jgi:hypothetical protein